jgi:uncharacterized circularly permuted ATP-grasp superfamily protein
VAYSRRHSDFVIEFFAKYDTGEFYDEMFDAPGQARPHYERLLQRFTDLKKGEFDRKRELAALTLLRQGVTFTVYNDAQGTERIFPFDLIPRIIFSCTTSIMVNQFCAMA